MKYIALVILFAFCIIACNFKNGSHSAITQKISTHDHIVLNDSGVFFLKKFYLTSDSLFLDTALFYFNYAIASDSIDPIAYSNRFTILNLKHDFSGSLICINRMLELSNYNPNIYLMKGEFFECNNLRDSAYSIYSSVNKTVGISLQQNRKFDLSKIGTYLITSSIINGRDCGEKRFDSISRIFHDTVGVDKLNYFKPTIDNIDTKNYLHCNTGK